MDTNELINRFKYHPPASPEVIDAHGQIRGALLDTALEFNQLLPECREKSLAVTKLEEAMFWANAAVARTQGVESVAQLKRVA